MLYCIAGCVLSGAVWAQEVATAPRDALPTPLTLDAALSMVDEAHPSMQVAQANIQRGEAELAQQDGQNGFQVNAEGKIRWIGLSASPGTMTQDHSIGLSARKRIYDFGYNNAGIDAAAAQLQSYRLQYVSSRAQRHLLIMRLFFDVILADYVFLRENERMATVFVQLDRLRERAKLGQASTIDIREKEVEYERTRLNWTRSETMQRVTRARLAQALNRPENLPGDLVHPKLKTHKRSLPELEALQKLARDNNPELLALRQQLKASEAKVMQARKSGAPKVDAEIGLNNYSRPIGQREDWSVGIVISKPLMDGGQTRAKISKAESEYYQIKAQLSQREMLVAQEVLELWAALQQLKIRREEVWAHYDYREMYLDRSRTLYEQELQTDLGDAMIELTEAQRLVAENDYSFALAWAELDALTGQLYKTDANQQGGQQ